MNTHALNRLREQLSQIHYKCKDNCFECCTVVPFLEQELKLMKKELRKNGYIDTPKGKGSGYCEFLTTDGRCSVYNERPIICRSFSGYKFKISNGIRSVLTPSCTYGSGEIKEATQEFIRYSKEVLNNGIVLDSSDEIINQITK